MKTTTPKNPNTSTAYFAVRKRTREVMYRTFHKRQAESYITSYNRLAHKKNRLAVKPLAVDVSMP